MILLGSTTKKHYSLGRSRIFIKHGFSQYEALRLLYGSPKRSPMLLRNAESKTIHADICA